MREMRQLEINPPERCCSNYRYYNYLKTFVKKKREKLNGHEEEDGIKQYLVCQILFPEWASPVRATAAAAAAAAAAAWFSPTLPCARDE